MAGAVCCGYFIPFGPEKGGFFLWCMTYTERFIPRRGDRDRAVAQRGWLASIGDVRYGDGCCRKTVEHLLIFWTSVLEIWHNCILPRSKVVSEPDGFITDASLNALTCRYTKKIIVNIVFVIHRHTIAVTHAIGEFNTLGQAETPRCRARDDVVSVRRHSSFSGT
jgi:hypothetical protein